MRGLKGPIFCPLHWYLLCLAFSFFFSACASQRNAATAEEYFSLGMAYFDLGKYAEAEKWLNRARAIDKTQIASEYNLGRIAFETGRYEEAARLFDRVLVRDPDNVMALKAAAYSRIKTGELAMAETLYSRVLLLEGESADDGYNYSLVLMALEKPEQAEAVLVKYQIALEESNNANNALLLLARAQRAQNKVEAADSYNQWLQTNSDPQVRYEYAQVLEQAELYARALEEYRVVLNTLPQSAPAPADPKQAAAAPQGPERPALRFTIARLLLIADSESSDGISELETAVSEGFADMDRLNALLDEVKISDAHKTEIRRVIDEAGKPKPEEPPPEEPQTEEPQADESQADSAEAPAA
jgi:tetratricopeptide (TPR) repeat protein